VTTPTPKAAWITISTRPKKMYFLLVMVGALPSWLMLKTAPFSGS